MDIHQKLAPGNFVVLPHVHTRLLPNIDAVRKQGHCKRVTEESTWLSEFHVLFGPIRQYCPQDFNQIYYSVGFEKDGGATSASKPTSVLRVERPASYDDLRNHIENRCHSNLKQMSDETIARLISLIPRDLNELDIRLDVFEFVPNPSRDALVQC